MGCGGTYFISCLNVIELTNIKHAKLCLRLDIDLDETPGHKCSNCIRVMSDKECDIFADLSDLTKIVDFEEKLDSEIKQKLVYIAGYLMKNYTYDHSEITFDYYLKYGDYLNEMNRGALKIPDDEIVQWVFLCYVLFINLSKVDLCRNSLTSYFLKLADVHKFEVVKQQVRSLSNIFFNNYCKTENPPSRKETAQKALKLNKNA